MSDWDGYFTMILTMLGIILFGFGYVVGEDRGADKFVNKICQQTQYEFCEPTYKYKAKEGKDE